MRENLAARKYLRSQYVKSGVCIAKRLIKGLVESPGWYLNVKFMLIKNVCNVDFFV